MASRSPRKFNIGVLGHTPKPEPHKFKLKHILQLFVNIAHSFKLANQNQVVTHHSFLFFPFFLQVLIAFFHLFHILADADILHSLCILLIFRFQPNGLA